MSTPPALGEHATARGRVSTADLCRMVVSAPPDADVVLDESALTTGVSLALLDGPNPGDKPLVRVVVGTGTTEHVVRTTMYALLAERRPMTSAGGDNPPDGTPPAEDRPDPTRGTPPAAARTAAGGP